jgi:hypothetical protein
MSLSTSCCASSQVYRMPPSPHQWLAFFGHNVVIADQR